MTPSARTYTGIMQIFFGESTVSGARGQHAVDFPHDARPDAKRTEQRIHIYWLGT